MALSDQLAKLSEQAKSLEDSVHAAEKRDKETLSQREGEVKASLEKAYAAATAKVQADGDEISSDWQKLKQSMSDDFASLRDSAEKRHTARAAKRADRAADRAEADAEDAVVFAIYALEQAEYYVLAAADAYVKAEDAELKAELKG